jgi:hypothetical protein
VTPLFSLIVSTSIAIYFMIPTVLLIAVQTANKQLAHSKMYILIIFTVFYVIFIAALERVRLFLFSLRKTPQGAMLS